MTQLSIEAFEPASNDTEDEPSEINDECDECAALPGEFPCADCCISGEKDFPEEDADE